MRWRPLCCCKASSMFRVRKADTMADRILKLRLTIAYDGTRLSGWQTQATGLGVQSLIEKALDDLMPGCERHKVHGAGRTDAGVHAMGMVAHVEVDPKRYRMESRRAHLALNARLPDEVRVLKVSRADPSFHARYDAKGKQYRYTVWNHSVMNPLMRDYAWHVGKRIDPVLVREAAKLFVGSHDFRSFAVNHVYHVEDTVRTLHRMDVRNSGCTWTFIIEGDGFLYRMCRGIVGTLVQVSHGRYTVDDVRAMLEAKNRTAAGMSAPACGLVLWKVMYPKRGEPKPNFVHRRNPRVGKTRARDSIAGSSE